MKDKITGKFIKTHGMKYTRFYRIWERMKGRCKSNKHYSDVNVSKDWCVFENFKKDMYREYVWHVKRYGEKDTTIDRKDNNRGYSKDNCRWATWKEQFANRNFLKYKCCYDGCETMTKSKWRLCEKHYKKLHQQGGLEKVSAWYGYINNCM